MTGTLEGLGEALGWTLYHSLWQGAISALLLLAVLTVTRSPRTRYAAACAALAAVLGGFVITLALQMPMSWRGAHMRIQAPGATAAMDLDSAGRDTGAFRENGLPPWLVSVWMAGAAVFQVRGILGWTAARRLRTRGVCSPTDVWRPRLGELAARMRVARPVELLETCICGVPAVIGHLRPLILLPAGLLASMPASQVEAILLHELAHVLRRDYLVNLLQTIAEGLLYYHPAVWWISGVIRAEREHCCDDLAVAASGGGAHEYASALAALEQSRWGLETRETAALAATGGSLVNRIHRLLYPRRPLLRPFAWPAATLMLTAVGVLVALAAPQQAPPPKEDPYTLWLKQDVAYIVEDRERETFQRLRTNEEREHFIEQFWARRDPTPGTPANEFKEQHYRRIAYANDRFRRKGVAGWTTDRGRIHIVYGPADEIESHPSGRGGGPPSENWLYRSVPGLGTNVIFGFVDAAKDGEYRLKDDPARQGARG